MPPYDFLEPGDISVFDIRIFTSLIELAILKMENHLVIQWASNSNGNGMAIYEILCSNFSGICVIMATEIDGIPHVPPVTKCYNTGSSGLYSFPVTAKV